ncbi:MAG: HD domain-containing protein, partial [Proteobacteria bacterium]|nr:HD domain-containing protein [Pseudomonadota bacterium]
MRGQHCQGRYAGNYCDSDIISQASLPDGPRIESGVAVTENAVPAERAHLFAYLYRLRLIGRWGLMRSTVPENVAEHTYQVAILTHALATISHDVFGRTDVPIDRAITLALFHDATEVITG